MKNQHRLPGRLIVFAAMVFTSCHPAADAKRASTPLVIRGPYLQSATPASIVIRWRTESPETGTVQYGTGTTLTGSAIEKNAGTEHIVRIAGLQPDTKYNYSLINTTDTTRYFFKTLPPAGKSGFYRIAAVGDCGNNSVNQAGVRDELMKYLGDRYLNAWILLGDNAYDKGLDQEFQTNFFNVYRSTLLPDYPLFPSPGNHDYGNADSTQASHDMAYYRQFTLPVSGEAGGTPSRHPAFYSFDLGNIHFLSLDSYGYETGTTRLYDTLGPQVVWIKKDLAENKNRGWVIAYWHHPPFTMGSHNSDEEEELVHIRENFIRILEREGVDLILCGHSHDHERSRLINGHYGREAAFRPEKNERNHSSGKYDNSPNSCPYIKDSTAQRVGTVYVVSGSAGQLGGQQKAFPHDALPYADADHGGVTMLEVDDNRLDVKWICADGIIRDRFTMMKQVNRRPVVTIKKGDSVTLQASWAGTYRWSGNGFRGRRLTLAPQTNTVVEVSDDQGCLKDRFEIRLSN